MKKTKTIPFLLFLLVISLLLINLLGYQPIKANPDWLSGWSYRKSHTIPGSSSGAVSDYSIPIVVHPHMATFGLDYLDHVFLNDHAESDFGDVRFTNASGTDQLGYYMDELPTPFIDNIALPRGVSLAYGIGETVVDQDPSIWQAENGTVFLCFSHEGRKFVYSDNWGITWSDLKDWNNYFGDIGSYNNVIRLADGTYSCVYRDTETSPTTIRSGKSPDGCAPWGDNTLVDSESVDLVIPFNNQLDNGTVLMTCVRADTSIIDISASHDNGLTWDSDYSTFDAELTPPLQCRYAQAEQFPNGTVALVWWEEVTNNRIMIALSNDRGKTWGEKQVFYDSAVNDRAFEFVILDNTHYFVAHRKDTGIGGYSLAIEVWNPDAKSWIEGVIYDGAGHETEPHCCIIEKGYYMFAFRHDGDGDFDVYTFTLQALDFSNARTFWIKVDNIPTNPDSATIYIYYGKEGETTTSSSDGFIFFDDFETDLSKWTVNQAGGTVAITTEQKAKGEKSVKLDDTTTNYVSIDNYDLMDTTVCVDYYARMGQTDKTIVCWYPRDTPDKRCRIAFFSTGYIRYYTTSYQDITTYSANTWYHMQYYISATTFDLYINGAQYLNDASLESTTLTDTGFEAKTALTGTMFCYIDHTIVRNYVEPEPQNGLWGNEETLGENYIVDITQTIITTWILIAMVNFKILASLTLTASWIINILSKFRVHNIVSFLTSWIVYVVHYGFEGIAYVANLTQTISITFTILVKANFKIINILLFATSWVINTVAHFNVLTSLNFLSSWIVHTKVGIQYIVNLTINLVTLWIVHVTTGIIPEVESSIIWIMLIAILCIGLPVIVILLAVMRK